MMKVRETKQATELKAGDVVTGWEYEDGQKHTATYVLDDTAKVTAKAITLFHSGGAQKRINTQGVPVKFNTTRDATDEEQRAYDFEAARLRIADARQRGANVATKIAKVNAEFAESVKKDGMAYTIKWRADGVVKALAILERWAIVDQVADRLFKSQIDKPYEERTLSIDEALVKAVLIVVKETERDLLRGYSSRSTNPYSNAIDDDERHGMAEWLRDFDVTGVLWAAKVLGVTVDEKEDF